MSTPRSPAGARENEAAAARDAARKSLPEFIRLAMPDIEPARHHRYVIGKLEQVAAGEIKRLMLFLPPGSAKSTYASVLFPPWWMGNHPSLPVIGASHSKELAERFGRRVRNIVGSPIFKETFGFGLSGDSGAAGRWETARGGEYFAVGVDASVTGRRAALGIIDDPVKGRAEADSAPIREHIWQWYKSDFWTRLIPDAALIYIGTRWHDDDLAGRLLEEAKTGGEQWEIVSLPAEAEENDALGREVGERLWAEWFTEERPPGMTLAHVLAGGSGAGITGDVGTGQSVGNKPGETTETAATGEPDAPPEIPAMGSLAQATQRLSPSVLTSGPYASSVAVSPIGSLATVLEGLTPAQGSPRAAAQEISRLVGLLAEMMEGERPVTLPSRR